MGEREANEDELEGGGCSANPTGASGREKEWIAEASTHSCRRWVMQRGEKGSGEVYGLSVSQRWFSWHCML